MHLYQVLLESDIPQAEITNDFLLAYFPDAIQAQFSDALPLHPLAKEIVATVLTNRIADQAGSCFIIRMVEQTGATPEQVAQAYLLFDAALNADTIRQAIFSLDNKMPTDIQHVLLLRLENCLAVLTENLLTTKNLPQLTSDAINQLRDDIEHFTGSLSSVLGGDTCDEMTREMEDMVAYGMDKAVAQSLSTLGALRDFLPVHNLVAQTGQDLFSVFTTYLDVRQTLHCDELLQMLRETHLPSRWDKMALRAVEKRLQESVSRLANSVCLESDCNSNTFFSRHRGVMRRWNNLFLEMQASPPVNLHPFTVMLDLIESIHTG
jgi:glutamate dehydrogenase